MNAETDSEDRNILLSEHFTGELLRVVVAVRRALFHRYR